MCVVVLKRNRKITHGGCHFSLFQPIEEPKYFNNVGVESGVEQREDSFACSNENYLLFVIKENCKNVVFCTIITLVRRARGNDT